MSAQKQCPKCGEKNPAEAVMCWACYTSLTGGGVGATALAGAGGPAIGGAAPMSDSSEKKGMDPKLLGVAGLCLLAAVGFGVNTMMSGDGDDPMGNLPTQAPIQRPAPSSVGATTATVTVGSVSVPLPPTTSAQAGGQQVPAQYYRTVLSPNPKQKWGTAAIVPTNGKVDEATARGYAVLFKQNMDNSKKFPALEIFVINDEASANTFKRYQLKRKNEPLTEAEFKDPELASVWSNTTLRYMWNGGRQTFSSPAKNPNSFWSDSGSGR